MKTGNQGKFLQLDLLIPVFGGRKTRVKFCTIGVFEAPREKDTTIIQSFWLAANECCFYDVGTKSSRREQKKKTNSRTEVDTST